MCPVQSKNTKNGRKNRMIAQFYSYYKPNKSFLKQTHMLILSVYKDRKINLKLISFYIQHNQI